MNKIYPFSAIVGQDQLKQALLLCAINPAIGGVLIIGDKGTAKSTAARALANLLPLIKANLNCAYNCEPDNIAAECHICHDNVDFNLISSPFINLPIGATEDKIIGTIDLERTIKEGKRVFQPGLLANANRGVLYVDEVNLLPDNLVDILLDVAAMGVNLVARDGIIIKHQSEFTLIGTMNPEEGNLRPQLLDRFGLMVEIQASIDPEIRTEIIRRRLKYENCPDDFFDIWHVPELELKEQILRAINILPNVQLSDNLLSFISLICCKLGIKSLRADITISKASKTLAALDNRLKVNIDDIHIASKLVLPHRKRIGINDSHGLDNEMLNDLINEAKAQSSTNKMEATKTQVDNSPVNIENLFDNKQNITIQANDNGQSVNIPSIVNTDLRFKLNSKNNLALSGSTSKINNHSRGHFIKAIPDENPFKLAVNETINHSLLRHGNKLGVEKQDFHRQELMNKQANLIIFIVDASGSMSALKRMEVVKGTVLSLLTDAYQRRDKVAVVSFKGNDAKLILRPTKSIDLAKNQLTVLETGGTTPLAAAINFGVKQALYSLKENLDPLIIFLTDGKANVNFNANISLETDLAQEALKFSSLNLRSIVIDTEVGSVCFNKSVSLAKLLKAQYLKLDKLTSESLTLAINNYCLQSDF